MYVAQKIQPTIPHGASTPQLTCFSAKSPSQPSSSHSLQTLMLPPPPVSNAFTRRATSYLHHQNHPGTPTHQNQVTNTGPIQKTGRKPPKQNKGVKRTATIAHEQPANSAEKIQPRPSPYHPERTPLPSELRPHCLCRDRLRLWRPQSARTPNDQNGVHLNLSEEDLTKILDVTLVSWESGTREAYGSGLLAFHIFCDERAIPEAQRAPADPLMIAAFTSSLGGSYSGSTANNYLCGVRAWHILHGLSWELNKAAMASLLSGVEKLAPPSSKRKRRLPFTIPFISSLLEKLDLNEPLDAAVRACLTVCFFSMARLGELTVNRIDGFNKEVHVSKLRLTEERDRNNLRANVLFVPRTKVALQGQNIYWSKQNGPADPEDALANHFRVNNPGDDDHLFSYITKGKRRPLTKSAFLTRLKKAAKDANLDPLQGHGIRIGATLEYLLRGVPVEAVKIMGRWASEAFTIYLRKHAQIMAPYLQKVPIVHQSFLQVTLPKA